jgi:hypothetical protein
MALVLSLLQSSLEHDWLVAQGGSYPKDAQESGDRFAKAVTSWFSAAQANGIPCATAQARRPELAQTAAGAFQVGVAQAAGATLALAVAGYIAGQTFGAGVASFPMATGACVAKMGAAFGNLDLTNAERSQELASACMLLASSTLIVFPPPLPPGPLV